MESARTVFDWGMFWQAASAIATAFAAIIALWQTRYQNRKKVKITFNESVIYAFGGSLELADKCQYVSLDVVNTGNRKIIISSYGIKLPDGYKWVILQEPTPAGIIKLPAELDIEQCVSFAWKKDKFIMQLQNLSDYPRNKKIPFFVQDTAGTYYIFKSPKTIQQYLDEAENQKKKKGDPNHDRTSTPQNDCCRGKHPAGV
ncbi:MAG: hypothetical protein MR651_09625 [Faecalibacterium sp.]|nr:hypothetical protein [Faecalibacterium sp.]